MGTQQFCLKWNNHQANMVTIFEQLLSTEALVDVTIACDGLSLKAHKMVLSACSPYFQSLFLENPCKHPIVIMKDMKYTELKAIIDFMYRGEVNVSHDQLNALLKTAETLKVKGLAEVCGERTSSGVVQQEVQQNTPSTPVHANATSTPVIGATHIPTRTDSPTLLSKRKRGRPRKRSLSDSNRSDDEQVPAKIKEPGSPDIEEISADTSLDTNISENISSNSQTHAPVTQFSKSSIVQSHQSSKSIQPAAMECQVEEPPSEDCDFELEPSKLMEQTLSTDVPKSTAAQNISSVQISSSSSNVNTALVPASVTSDFHSSQMEDPESPQDIKPVLLTFEEPPVAGTSQDSNSMMYMESPGVPSIPGTSFQDSEGGQIVQHDSQQGILASEENGDFYNVVLRPYSYSEKESSYSFEVISTTRTDLQVDGDIQGCAQSESVQPVPDSFKCFPDGDVTQRTTPPDIEVSEIVVASDTNSESRDYEDQNLSPGNSDNHGDHASNVKDAEYSTSSKNVSVQMENPNVAQFRNPTISFKKLSHGYRFYCPFCSYHSKYRQAVLVHVRQHTGEKPYVCDYCEKAFAVKQNFLIHVKRHEALLKLFMCNVCQKYFSSKQLLRRHSWICRKVKSHKCDICERTFSKKNHLMLHLKVHSGVKKQFKCSLCAKEYFYKKSLLRHQETHAEQG